MYAFSFLISWMLFIDSETHAKYNYLPILQSVREISGKNVPVWNWWSSGAYLPLRIFGPEKYGGLGDVANKARHRGRGYRTGCRGSHKGGWPLLPILISVLETDKQLDDEHEAG
jgi:hypothetical protein